jgi:hypothetical protein
MDLIRVIPGKVVQRAYHPQSGFLHYEFITPHQGNTIYPPPGEVMCISLWVEPYEPSPFTIKGVDRIILLVKLNPKMITLS